jgi:hypothetical protein
MHNPLKIISKIISSVLSFPFPSHPFYLSILLPFFSTCPSNGGLDFTPSMKGTGYYLHSDVSILLSIIKISKFLTGDISLSFWLLVSGAGSQIYTNPHIKLNTPLLILCQV